MPPALWEEWPGPFTCYCGNTGDGTELGYRNHSQHRKLTLEKKIPPPLLPGFEPMAVRSRVRIVSRPIPTLHCCVFHGTHERDICHGEAGQEANFTLQGKQLAHWYLLRHQLSYVPFTECNSQTFSAHSLVRWIDCLCMLGTLMQVYVHFQVRAVTCDSPSCCRSGKQNDLGHSVKSADGRLQLNTHAPNV